MDWESEHPDKNLDPTEGSKWSPTWSYTAKVRISVLTSHRKEKTNPTFRLPGGNLTAQKNSVRYFADCILGFKRLCKKTNTV